RNPSWQAMSVLISSRRRMRPVRAILGLFFFALVALPVVLNAQQQEYIVEALNTNGWAEWDETHKLFTGTNGVRFQYGEELGTSNEVTLAIGSADEVAMNVETGDVVAEGHVRLQRDD